MVNFHDYLSDDTAIVCAVCEMMPPAKALVTLETALTEEQRQGFKFMHKEGGGWITVQFTVAGAD